MSAQIFKKLFFFGGRQNLFLSACVHRPVIIACSLLLLTLLSIADANATDRPPSPHIDPPAQITGKVTDSKNAPLEGVSVTLKG